MILNKMQQRVVASKKRVTVITAQAGAGSSTALFFSLVESAKKDPKGLVIFCADFDSVHERLVVGSFKKAFPNSRYSKESKILTIKTGMMKAIKIKFVDSDYDFSYDYVSAVAFDHNINKNTLKKALLFSGRVYINDWAKKIPNAWGLDLGLVFPTDQGFKFADHVENVKGLAEGNPGVTQSYLSHLRKAPNFLVSTEM